MCSVKESTDPKMLLALQKLYASSFGASNCERVANKDSMATRKVRTKQRDRPENTRAIVNHQLEQHLPTREKINAFVPTS